MTSNSIDIVANAGVTFMKLCYIYAGIRCTFHTRHCVFNGPPIILAVEEDSGP